MFLNMDTYTDKIFLELHSRRGRAFSLWLLRKYFPASQSVIEMYRFAVQEINKNPSLFKFLAVFERFSHLILRFMVAYVVVFYLFPMFLEIAATKSVSYSSSSTFYIGILFLLCLSFDAFLKEINFYGFVLPVVSFFGIKVDKSVAAINSSVLNGFLRFHDPERFGDIKSMHRRVRWLSLFLFLLSCVLFLSFTFFV